MAHMIATSATRPIVNPTAAPVPNPPEFFDFETGVVESELGGIVGVTVTVRTSPVTVSREVTGVGVHVDVADSVGVTLAKVSEVED